MAAGWLCYYCSILFLYEYVYIPSYILLLRCHIIIYIQFVTIHEKIHIHWKYLFHFKFFWYMFFFNKNWSVCLGYSAWVNIVWCHTFFHVSVFVLASVFNHQNGIGRPTTKKFRYLFFLSFCSWPLLFVKPNHIPLHDTCLWC